MLFIGDDSAGVSSGLLFDTIIITGATNLIAAAAALASVTIVTF